MGTNQSIELQNGEAVAGGDPESLEDRGLTKATLKEIVR